MAGDWVLEIIGSGDFLLWAREVDGLALARARPGDGSVVVLPTAMAPHGDEAIQAEARKAREHFGSMGAAVRVLPVLTREDAARPDLAAEAASASLVFLVGGYPHYLATTLRGTPLWAAVVEAVNAGAALGGCSAGAWVMGELAPDSSATELFSHRFVPGLGMVPGVVFAAHWDELDSFIPDLQAHTMEAIPKEWTLVTFDRCTAILGDGTTWEVLGEGCVGVYRAEERRTYWAGDSFETLPARE